LQSFVTLEVTRCLNYIGLATLLILAGDMIRGERQATRANVGCMLCWVGMAISLGALMWLHPQLSGMMDPKSQTIPDPEGMYPLHRAYLIISTIQWLCALVFLALTLRTWRAEDRVKIFSA
jgi:hypothetical protein